MRTLAGSEAVGKRHRRQFGENLGKRQVLAKGEQYLLVVTAQNSPLSVGEECRIERFETRTEEISLKSTRSSKQAMFLS